MSEPMQNYISGVREGLTNLSCCMYDDNGRNCIQLTDIDSNSNEENSKTFAGFNNQHVAEIFSVNGDASNFPSISEDMLTYSCPETANAFSCDPHILKKNANYDLLKYHSNEDKNSIYSKAKTGNKAASRNGLSRSKSVRKFRFIHAFVPSFIFVVLAMFVSAIVVLESESDVLKQFRNLPEMVSLRFQYYQPIKDYFLRHVGKKS